MDEIKDPTWATSISLIHVHWNATKEADSLAKGLGKMKCFLVM